METTVTRPTSHVQYTSVGGEIVILDQQRGVYLGLDEVGTVIWQCLIEQGMDVRAVVHRLTQQYKVSQQIAERDVSGFVDNLKAKGVLDSDSRSQL